MRAAAHSKTAITLEGTEEEIEAVHAMLAGTKYLHQDSDAVVGLDKFNPLPAPIDDPALKEHWQTLDKIGNWGLWSSKEPISYLTSPAICIQHLCGYYYSEANYKKAVTQLESFGFHCLRSRRKSSGRFWEIWYLPGLWAAEGQLRKHIGKDTAGQENLEKAVAFLCQHVSFGTLDATTQRAAMRMD